MPKIVLEHITKRWGNYFGVDDLNLVIDDNSFITLLGPSGCGKTTTLRMIAGLETPTSGKITIGDQVVFDSEYGINVPASKRKVGFLFQNYALWPNMTVYQNISFGLKNVKEEMPVYDYEIITTKQINSILANPTELIDIIEECKDKKGKVLKTIALIKIIDKYEVSMMSAKQVYSFGELSKEAVVEAANKAIAANNKKIEALVSAHAQKGITVNENGELVKDGQVVRKVRKLEAEEIDLAVRRCSRIVKIGEFMDRYPAELSGGQQQRVAIARTLAPQPSVLFMDEPLSNLDAKLRLEMRSELQRLHIDTGSTFVYVTHDQLEAMTLATKICLMNNSVLQQYDAPLTVYKTPVNLFAADFVGNPSINFIDTKGAQDKDGAINVSLFNKYSCKFVPNEALDLDKWVKDELALQEKNKQEEAAKKQQKGYVDKSNKIKNFKYNIAKVASNSSIDVEVEETLDSYVIGVRPEFIKFDPNGAIEGEIYSAMPAGMETTVKVRIGEFLLTGVIFGGTAYRIGEKIRISIEGNEILIFHRQSNKLVASGSLKF